MPEAAMASASGGTFGELLRHLREAAGLTQARLAEKAGLSPRGLNDLERGARKAPRWDTVARLADALALAPAERQAFVAAAHVAHAAARAAHANELVGEVAVPGGANQPPAVEGTTNLFTPHVSPTAPTPLALPDDAQQQQLPLGRYLGALPEGLLVGRESERARLRAAVEAVSSGQGGRLLLLAGEAGIGKTRLAQETTRVAHERGFLIVTGRCYEPQQTVAFYPFLEVLSRAYSAAPESLRAELPRRWPDVARLLPDQPIGLHLMPSSGTREEQVRVFLHVTGFLRALADVQPVALLLDDLQWADSASLDLMQHLTRHTHASRVLMLGTYRDAEVTRVHPLEAVLRDLGREQLFEQLTIRRLSQEGTAQLMASSFGLENASDEFAATLHARTEGNPFFTVEVLRDLIERGDIYREHGRWRNRAQGEIVLPESVRLVILHRVGRLTAESQTILQEASVLGQVFGFADLQAMGTRVEAAVDAALEEARAAALVREPGNGRYSFHHVLIQQVLYTELTSRRRRGLHRAAGEALERLGERERERRVAELAYHFSRTDQWEKALRYLRESAEQAGAAGARREEAALLVRAIACAENLDQSDLATELRAKRGNVLLAVGTRAAWTEAAEELNATLAQLAATTTSPVVSWIVDRRIRVLCTLAAVHYQLLDSANQRKRAAEALALAEALAVSEAVPQEVSDYLMALAAATNAEASLSFGDSYKSLELFERAFAAGSELHRADLVLGIRQYGINLHWLGRCGDHDIERSRAVADIALEARDPNAVGLALSNHALLLTTAGRYAEAMQVFDDARRYTREQGMEQWYGRAICMLGGFHLEIFSFNTAEALANEAREVARSANWPPTAISADIDLLFNFVRSKQVGQAEALLPEIALALAGASGVHGWLWPIRYAQAKAELALERREWQRALQYAQDAAIQAHPRGRVKYEALSMQAHALALAGLGRTKEAIIELRQAIDRARPVGDPAMFLRAASALLAIAGDDTLLAEARATIERMAAALPGDLRRTFLDAEPVRLVTRLGR
jgi:predicted ATPase/transcriptional regulator with XRE-family HTH domain